MAEDQAVAPETAQTARMRRQKCLQLFLMITAHCLPDATSVVDRDGKHSNRAPPQSYFCHYYSGCHKKGGAKGYRRAAVALDNRSARQESRGLTDNYSRSLRLPPASPISAPALRTSNVLVAGSGTICILLM